MMLWMKQEMKPDHLTVYRVQEAIHSGSHTFQGMLGWKLWSKNTNKKTKQGSTLEVCLQWTDPSCSTKKSQPESLWTLQPQTPIRSGNWRAAQWSGRGLPGGGVPWDAQRDHLLPELSVHFFLCSTHQHWAKEGPRNLEERGHRGCMTQWKRRRKA